MPFLRESFAGRTPTSPPKCGERSDRFCDPGEGRGNEFDKSRSIGG